MTVLRRPSARVLLRIALRESASPQNAGLEALALDLAAKGSADMAPDGMARALEAASAGLSLVASDDGGPALELACPADSLYSLLDLLGRSFSDPAFRPEDFDRSLMSLRVEERRRHSDRSKLAAIELDAVLRSEGRLARGPADSASSLASMSLDEVVRLWTEDVDGARLQIAAVGAVDPDVLAARLSLPGGLGSLPRRSLREAGSPAAAASPAAPAVQAAGLSIPSSSPLILVGEVPGSSGEAVELGAFDAPSIDSPDFAALRVATTMLYDLLSRELRTTAADEVLHMDLSSGGRGTGSLEVQGSGEAASVLGAVARALATLASGRCLDPVSEDGAFEDIAAALPHYRARSLVDFYEPFASPSAMVGELSRLSDAGADPAEFFGTADRMAAVSRGDVLRVATEYLAQTRISWIALGDPELLAALAATSASRHY